MSKYYVTSLDLRRIVDAQDPEDAVIRALVLESYRDFSIGANFQISEIGFGREECGVIDAVPFMNIFAKALNEFN